MCPHTTCNQYSFIVVFQTILNKLSENGFCITSMPAKKIECAFCKEHFETKEELGSHVISHKG